MENKQRFGELDALRGIAALSIVLFHYTSLYVLNYSGKNYVTFMNFKYGGTGVQLFFIISGYVIYMTILKCTNIKEFTLKRVIRLYPAYIIAVLSTYLCTSFYYLEGIKVTAKEFLFNLTMFQKVIPGFYVRDVDGSYWTLAVEICFYIFCGLLMFIKLINKPLLVCTIWLASLFTVKVLDPIHFFQSLGNLEIVKYSHLFIAGIIFYNLRNLNFLWSWKSFYCHSLIVVTLLYNFINFGILSTGTVLIFYFVFYLFLLNKLRFLNNKLLIFLGTISYSLYLIHQYIGYIILKILENMGLSNQIYIVIPLLFSITLATFITYYIEKPIQRWSLNKLTARTNNKSIKKVISM